MNKRPIKNNYKVALEKGWEELLKKDPEVVAKSMNVTYLAEEKRFIVPHLNEEYIVDCIDKNIRKKDEAFPVEDINLSILILHYLSFFTEEKPLLNKWVSLKEIPNGGVLFYPAFYKDSILKLLKYFGRDSKLFIKCAKKIGGCLGPFGTTSAVFRLFPKIPVCVVIWEGDEELPANASILFDLSISYFLHIESIIGVSYYLIERLIHSI